MIIIYRTETCPYCHEAKEFLDSKSIPYKEIDVSKDEKAAARMVKKSGQLGVPVLDINGQIVVGFDREKILKLIQK